MGKTGLHGNKWGSVFLFDGQSRRMYRQEQWGRRFEYPPIPLSLLPSQTISPSLALVPDPPDPYSEICKDGHSVER